MHRKNRRLLVVSLAVVAVGGVAAGGIALATGGTPVPGSASGPAAEAIGSTTPTSSAAIAATDAAPSAEPAPTETSDSAGPAASGAPVQVVLAFAEWDAAGQRVEAAGFVADAIESGGICALELTRAGARVEATRDAEADASTTTCGALTVPGDQLAAGEWQATLSYRSARSTGTSQPMTVTVPVR
jgi:hypothetical protein